MVGSSSELPVDADLSAKVRQTLEPSAGRDGVVSTYIFGSHATDRAHRESDVDIGVLLDRTVHPTREARFEARIRLIGQLGRALKMNALDVVVVNDAPPHLARRILCEGQRIFCADPDTDHAARRTALLRAADLEPFLHRARRLKLQVLAR
jgi:predicted nucleotidyltransferase